MKLRSLRVQLLLMLTLIALIAVGTVALFASYVTRGAFRNYVKNQQPGGGAQLAQQITTSYYQDHNAQKIQVLVDQAIKAAPPVRILVIDSSMKIIADSQQRLNGKVFTTQLLLTLNKNSGSEKAVQAGAPAPAYEPVRIISTDVGDLLSDPHQPPPASNSMPQQMFFTTVNSSLLQTVIIVGLLSMLLTFLLSNSILKPVQALIFAASRMAQGDLSQRVRINAQNEIGELAHAFNCMADSLERSEQLRRNQVSDVAHELRTPLTNIRGYLEAIQDGVIEPQPPLITSLYEEAMLLTRLVTDLQDLTLAEAGQLRLQCAPIALEGIITAAINGLALQAKNKGISMDVEIAADLPLVMADPQRIGQILRNLLTNAIKHTPPQGKIIVCAQAIPQAVQVHVQDSGVGIDEDHLPHLFKRFYRADRSRSRATGGTGLGLAVVAQLVQAHGGQVSVESQVGQGSTFTFTLPLLSEQALSEMNAPTVKLH